LASGWGSRCEVGKNNMSYVHLFGEVVYHFLEETRLIAFSILHPAPKLSVIGHVAFLLDQHSLKLAS